MTDHARLDRITADIGRDLAAIAARMHRLIERAHINPQPDGYPRRASGAEPSTAPTPIDPDHDGSLDYADPTGNTTTQPPVTDPVSRSVNAIWRRLDCAANDLLRAAEMARELANPTGVVELEHPWCTNHWRIQRPNGERIHRELAWRRDRLRYPTLRLCSFCGEFNEAHGQLPPEGLLAHLDRHPSARLTPALIDRYLGTPKQPAERRGKRKKGWVSA